MNPNQQPYQQSPYTPQPRYQPPVQVSPTSRPPRSGRLKIVVLVVGAFLALGAVVYLAASSGGDSQESASTATTPEDKANDTKQKTTASSMSAAIARYAADNNGAYPEDSADLQIIVTDYEPETSGYVFYYKSSYNPSDLPDTSTAMHYYGGYKCDGNEVEESSSKRTAALVYLLSNDTYGCANI
jgi:hypothetical protein